MKHSKCEKIVNILLVEDNSGDAYLIGQLLEKSTVCNHLHLVENGEQAMAFLRKEDPYRDSPRPDLVLLDLNLPGMDGRQVLAEIKSDPELSIIPVVVLTSSASEEDLIDTYRNHTNSYVTKPLDFEQFRKVFSCLMEYWFTIVKLPPVPQECDKR